MSLGHGGCWGLGCARKPPAIPAGFQKSLSCISVTPAFESLRVGCEILSWGHFLVLGGGDSEGLMLTLGIGTSVGCGIWLFPGSSSPSPVPLGGCQRKRCGLGLGSRAGHRAQGAWPCSRWCPGALPVWLINPTRAPARAEPGAGCEPAPA